MEWFTVDVPPIMEPVGEYGWPESEPVIVRCANGYKCFATYEQIYESEACWYSHDSERWQLNNVTHWCYFRYEPMETL